jgi:hypothetical protein
MEENYDSDGEEDDHQMEENYDSDEDGDENDYQMNENHDSDDDDEDDHQMKIISRWKRIMIQVKMKMIIRWKGIMIQGKGNYDSGEREL